MMMKTIWLFFFFSSTAMFGGVNLKNGNFYITYTDLIVGDLKIERTYNSRATGSFEMGYGWGFDYAGHVLLPPDGVTVLNNGSGSITPLLFQEGSEAGRRETQDLSEAFLRARVSPGTAFARKFTGLLLDDKERRDAMDRVGLFRSHNHEHPIFQGGVAMKPPYFCGNPDCTAAHGGYAIHSDAHIIYGGWNIAGKQGFAPSGEMLELSDGKNLPIEVKRNETGNVEMIIQGADYIRFFYDSRGNLNRLVGSNGQEAEISINGRGDLVYSRDSGDNEYWHDYDANHNMVRIGYTPMDAAESDEILIDYDEKTFCNAITDRDGTHTDYLYDTDPDNPEFHYFTSTTRVPLFSPVVHSDVEYLIGNSASGVRHTRKIVHLQEGVTVTWLYDDDGKLESKVSDASTPFEKVESDGLTLSVKGPIHHYDRTHDGEGNFLTKLEIHNTQTGQVREWKYQYAVIAGQPTMISASEGGARLVFVPDGEICALSSGQEIAWVRKDGKVSNDRESWYGVEFKRTETDGPLLAELCDDEGTVVGIPDLEEFLNRFRLPIGVSARQFLPEQLHAVGWQTYDL